MMKLLICIMLGIICLGGWFIYEFIKAVIEYMESS